MDMDRGDVPHARIIIRNGQLHGLSCLDGVVRFGKDGDDGISHGFDGLPDIYCCQVGQCLENFADYFLGLLIAELFVNDRTL